VVLLSDVQVDEVSDMPFTKRFPSAYRLVVGAANQEV